MIPMRVLRFVEEIVPFVFYFVRSRRQRRRSESGEILSEKKFTNYIALSKDKLEERLEEEHQRASTIDEKTSKLTLSFSIALTFVGAAMVFLKNTVSPVVMQTVLPNLVNFLIFLGLFYSIVAGLVALGALRTERLYGYGTSLLLRQDKPMNEILAKSLACQEVINLVRHTRNEAAFQSLRNGLWIFVAVIVIFMGIFVWRFLSAFSLSIC